MLQFPPVHWLLLIGWRIPYLFNRVSSQGIMGGDIIMYALWTLKVVHFRLQARNCVGMNWQPCWTPPRHLPDAACVWFPVCADATQHVHSSTTDVDRVYKNRADKNLKRALLLGRLGESVASCAAESERTGMNSICPGVHLVYTFHYHSALMEFYRGGMARSANVFYSLWSAFCCQCRRTCLRSFVSRHTLRRLEISAVVSPRDETIAPLMC